MIEGLIEGLVAAWILDFFGIDEAFIEVLQPFVKEVQLTAMHYYFVFAVIGLLSGIFNN